MSSRPHLRLTAASGSSLSFPFALAWVSPRRAPGPAPPLPTPPSTALPRHTSPPQHRPAAPSPAPPFPAPPLPYQPRPPLLHGRPSAPRIPRVTSHAGAGDAAAAPPVSARPGPLRCGAQRGVPSRLCEEPSMWKWRAGQEGVAGS